MIEIEWISRGSGFYAYKKGDSFGPVGLTLVRSLGVWGRIGASLGTGVSAVATAPDGTEHASDGHWSQDEAKAWVERIVAGCTTV